MRPAAAKPPTAGIKPSGAKPPAPGINKLAVGQASGNPQRTISPPNSARSNGSNPQRAVSPPSASNGRAPLEHKNSQVGLGRPTSDPKNKASYGTIIRNWNNAPASKANLAMLEKKNLLPLTLLHRHNNVKVQSVASEVIDSLIELSDGSIGMDPSKVNGFRPLVDLCKRDDIDSEIPVLVVQSLAHLAAHQTCRAPILGEVGWFNIPKFARSSDVDMKVACALLIGNLSHEVANQKSIIEKGVPLLQENLRDAKTPELRAAFLSAFADVSQIKEYGAQEIWDQSLLKYVFPPIKTGSNREEMFAAVSLLCNICDTPTISVHKEIVDGGVVDKLYDLLKSDSDEMQANIALIFARLGKSSVGRQKLESLPSFKNLIDRLLSKVPITQFQVAGALDVLADSDAIKKILKKEDCVEVLQEIILSSSGHAQVEELSLSVLKKLDSDRWKVVAEKHANKVRAQAESAPEETLQFSPRRRDSSPPEPKNLKPAASDIPQPRSRTSVKMQPLQSLTPSSMDADRMQKDHQMEVQKLQEEKKRLEELLRKEREAERESSKYTAASPGSNIDDKIKGSLKSIQESINLEVDLLGDERRKIEEWKRAIENFRGERIIYEKDLEIFRKDKEHQAKEKEQMDKEKQTLLVETDKIEKEKKNLNSENEKLEKERAKLQEELAALAKSREKLQKEKEEFEKERENERAAFNGKVELSSLDKERADREREKAEKAEKEREKMEQERDEAEKERKRLEQLLENERQKYKQELEEERRRREEEERKREEERERNAKGSKSEEDKQAALLALQNDYEEITLKFEKEKKKFEREKEQMQAEIDILKESNGKSGEESSGKLSEMQRMINLLEENLEESQKTNKILEDKVDELEDELKRLRAERNMSDNQLQAELEEERRRSEELAKKLAEAQEELERRGDNDDLDERQRKQLAEDLKKIEEWEKAKEREKIENQKKLDEEIEFLKQRHASWERKQAIAMADLIEKEKALYDKETDLKKYDDDLYERETKVHDAESRPSRGRDYSDSDRSYSEDDSYSRRHSSDDWSDDGGSGDDRTLSLSSSSEDITIDSPRKKPSRDKEKEQREREQRERERLEREREEKQKRLSQKASSPKPKPGTPNMRPKSGLKSSSGLKNSSGIGKPATPKPRPPIDYMDTLDDLDDDDDDVFSVEGLAQSDPYEAARKLLALLELDPSRSTEADIATLKKFAKNRSGAPTQYEARDIIPTLIHILRVCTDPSHEEIINTCLLILAILAYNKDANQLYIRRAQGGPLFEIFLSFSIVSVKARAALAIAAYCLNNISIKNEMGQTAVATLCTMLKDADPVIKKSASTALASLVDNNKYNKKIVKKQGGVKTLLDLMRDNQIPAKYSLHLLASLAHDSKSIKKEVPKHFPNVFRKIILILSPFTKPSVLAAAVASLMELARNSPANQKAIWKAKATNYLVTILINKDRYNNDDLIVNTLFLCWVIARISPKGLADKEFYDPKWSMADILKTLKDTTNNEVIKKIIYQMENMIRTADVAGKGEKGEKERKGERPPSRPSPTPPPASPALSSSSGINNKNNSNNNDNNAPLSSSSRLSASVTLSSSGVGPSRATPSPQPGPSK